jgi:hypothetical protein
MTKKEFCILERYLVGGGGVNISVAVEEGKEWFLAGL